MAKLLGNLKIKGSLGGLSFIPSGEEIIVREKTSISRKRIAKDPAFARTRMQNKEFSSAVIAASLLRKALKPVVFQAMDASSVNRLLRMFRILKSDRQHTVGERKVQCGNMDMLYGFEFKEASSLQQVLLQRFQITKQESSGSMEAMVSEFIPACAIVAPSSASHFRIVLAVVCIDWGSQKAWRRITASSILPCNQQEPEDLLLSLDLDSQAGNFITVMGIEFFEHLQGLYCPLEKGRYNCMGMVDV